MWSGVSLFLLLLVAVNGQKLDKLELWPDRDVGRVSAVLPPYSEHVWMINGVPNSIIRLRCSEITQASICSMSNITVIDDRNVGAVCGSHRNADIESKSANLILVISTAALGGTRVNCVATSQLRRGNNIPSYLTDVSREIDSAEHGGKQGTQKTSCPCGWTNKPKAASRIVGGSVTGINEYPLTASLIEIMKRTGGTFSYFRFCGGTIISPWHIITAAHCTIEIAADPRRELAVILGDHDHTRWDETDANVIVMIERIINHERYNPRTTQNDIALLKTKTQIKFSDKVGPACLPTGPLNMVSQYVKGVGWGMTAHPGTDSKVLKKVWIQVLPLSTCAPFYPGSVNMADQHQLCVFGKQRGLCMGDSGGPVIWLDPKTNRYTLVGVVSFGKSCSDFYPDIVTDVSTFLPWIKSKIQATTPAQTCSAV